MRPTNLVTPLALGVEKACRAVSGGFDYFKRRDSEISLGSTVENPVTDWETGGSLERVLDNSS